MRSTERVPADALTTYEDLGDPRFSGRLCLRTCNNEYNQSLVADLIAKRGEAATEQLLRSWMANEPQILGSDVDVLEAIAAGRCDVGLTNHYYLGRELADDPGFPVAPAWPDQDGAGAHTNLSGVGLVKGAEHRADAIRLMEHLTGPRGAGGDRREQRVRRQPRRPAGRAHPRLGGRQDATRSTSSEAGRRLPDAVALMQRVGWK